MSNLTRYISIKIIKLISQKVHNNFINLPNAVNLVKKVGDLREMRGKRIMMRKRGAVVCRFHMA